LTTEARQIRAQQRSLQAENTDTCTSNFVWRQSGGRTSVQATQKLERISESIKRLRMIDKLKFAATQIEMLEW
jgi:phage shock protein A